MKCIKYETFTFLSSLNIIIAISQILFENIIMKRERCLKFLTLRGFKRNTIALLNHLLHLPWPLAIQSDPSQIGVDELPLVALVQINKFGVVWRGSGIVDIDSNIKFSKS